MSKELPAFNPESMFGYTRCEYCTHKNELGNHLPCVSCFESYRGRDTSDPKLAANLHNNFELNPKYYPSAKEVANDK